MNKKTLKIITIIATIIAIVCSCTLVLADDSLTPNSLKPSYSGTSSITTVGTKIMGIINTIGVVVAVVVLMVLGIKYMMGSAQEKAEYKKTMIPYVIGAVFIFAAATIANMVYNFANGLNTK